MTIPTDLEQWLKSSIGGIILLGALGSLIAVVIGRLLFALAKRILPAPYRAYRKQSRKQAYFMGYSAGAISSDETGNMILTLLIFRLARFFAALTLFIFAAILIINLFVFQARIALTIGIFVAVVLEFLALYWAYFEFEWIFRKYLWQWKHTVEKADETYRGPQPSKRSASAQDVK